MKSYKAVLIIPMLLIGLALVVIASIRNGALNPTEDYLKIRFTDSRSKFLTIDGVPIHVVEEGPELGPVIILIHGHLGSNRQWDGWAEDLRADFRVVRLDYPPFGISGPDPTGQYSSSRAYHLLVNLIHNLGYKRFHMAGTSSGGILALRYAADHPDQVEKLLLSSVPAYVPTDRLAPPRAFAAISWFSDNVFKVWRPELYWRLFMENIFGHDELITSNMVSEYASLNNRPDSIKNVRTFIFSNARSNFDVAAAAARITAPILIQWAGGSPVLTKAGLERVAPLFKNSQVRIIEYPDLGHKLMLEDPARTVGDARIFLQDE
ncbi:MAG: alpha/beta fold hydrolase [Rhodospirillaceae bacterium]